MTKFYRTFFSVPADVIRKIGNFVKILQSRKETVFDLNGYIFIQSLVNKHKNATFGNLAEL